MTPLSLQILGRPKNCWSMAYHFLPSHHLPRLLLPRQPHPRHRGHELRRASEEGRGGGRGRSVGGRSSQSKFYLVILHTNHKI